MTKIDIISGFLGAGKTTFIKEMISKVYTGERIVLIENEYGEIGIDGGFMKESGIEVTEMNSGCICCTLVGDFSKSIKQVVTEFAPDRIMIEPSGVGKLSEVAAAVAGVSMEADLEINSRITVVDGKRAKMYAENFGEFYNDQIEHATTIVISRTQMMEEAELAAVMEMLREHNKEAIIITTPWDQLEGAVIKDAIEHGQDLEKELLEEYLEAYREHAEHEHEHHHHHHHHDHDDDDGDDDDHDHDHHHHDHDHDDDDDGDDDHEHHHHHHDHDDHDHDHDHHHHHHHHHHDHDADEIFDSWGIETIHKFTREGLEATLDALSGGGFGTVLRAKGIVELEDGTWAEFDMVPEEKELRSCSPNFIGKVCVIGADLDREAIAAEFEKQER